jgi:ribosomal protein S1/(E)-4-hydroxy-3-methyl-but-2-enyl pyrophosphate reductase
MEIVLAKCTGYCLGVKRALDLVEKALVEGPHPVSTLGQIIHNPEVVRELDSRGARVVDSPEEVSQGTLILRSHGTVRQDKTRIHPDVRVVDATCPFVSRAQDKAQEYSRKGIPVVLVGDKNHPETKAILSYAGEMGFCVKTPDDLEEVLPDLKGGPVAVLAQTTSRRQEVGMIVKVLEEAGISVQSANTICTATHERQSATMELAETCQVIIVVGGRTSANTRQLLRIAEDGGREAYLVESAGDVQADWLLGKSKVGIAAGASTPDRVIKEVVGTVEDLTKSNLEKEPEEAKCEEAEKEEVTSQESVSQELSVSPTEPDETEAKSESPEKSADEIVQELYDESFKALQEGQIVKGRVVSIDDNGALVDVGAKSEGLIPASELNRKGAFSSEPLSPGDEIMVYVQSSDSGEGGLRLSKRRADEEVAWQMLQEGFSEGSVIEAPVVQEVKGGLVVDVGLRGFVPASQVQRGYVNDLSQYVGQSLRLKVLELDRSKNRVVLSQRAVLEEEHEALCRETWETIAEGQVRQGLVKGITDFGVFVDLGGVDGLLHISELSWGRVKHPSEVVREGDQIEVKVLRVDKEKGKISLGRKQVLPDPWDNVAEKYPLGMEIDGEVTRTAPFGAFVQLEPGVEGLVHISEISDRHITKPEEEVNSGDKVRVKVLRVRPDERRISLSIRQADQTVLQAEPAEESRETPVKDDEGADATEEIAGVPEGSGEVPVEPVEVSEETAEVSDESGEVPEKPAEVSEESTEVPEEAAEAPEKPIEMSEEPVEPPQETPESGVAKPE